VLDKYPKCLRLQSCSLASLDMENAIHAREKKSTKTNQKEKDGQQDLAIYLSQSVDNIRGGSRRRRKATDARRGEPSVNHHFCNLSPTHRKQSTSRILPQVACGSVACCA
jgi:hypothetical protein